MARVFTFSNIYAEGPARGADGPIAGAPASTLEFAVHTLGFVPDAKQRLVLESSAKRGILNCSRQWGKSSVAAVKAVHRAVTEPEALVMVASPTERQSAEFLRKAERFVARMGMKPRGDGANEHSILFPNGSRIVGLPGTEATVRGFSAVGLLVIDEASRVADEMYTALRPMLAASDGDLWLLSTPKGKRGFFYDVWANGGTEWEKVAVAATECSRIKPEFLEGERSTMGAECFEQEYLCRFMDDGSAWVGREMAEGALMDFEVLGI